MSAHNILFSRFKLEDFTKIFQNVFIVLNNRKNFLGT